MIAALSTVNPTCLLGLWDEFVPQLQGTMNRLCTLQRNSKIFAYEETEGAFDWNRTTLAPLRCKAVVYQDPNARTSWAPHPCDAFYLGHTPLHYRLKEYCMADTYFFSYAVGKLYPAHCATPSISEADLTVSATTDLIDSMQGRVLATAAAKQRHTKVLQKLITIPNNSKSPRVANGGLPRVIPEGSRSTNVLSLKVIADTRFVHQ